MMHVPLVHSFTRGSSVVVRPPAGAALQRWRCSGRVVVVRGHAGTTSQHERTPRHPPARTRRRLAAERPRRLRRPRRPALAPPRADSCTNHAAQLHSRCRGRCGRRAAGDRARSASGQEPSGADFTECRPLPAAPRCAGCRSSSSCRVLPDKAAIVHAVLSS